MKKNLIKSIFLTIILSPLFPVLWTSEVDFKRIFHSQKSPVSNATIENISFLEQCLFYCVSMNLKCWSVDYNEKLQLCQMLDRQFPDLVSASGWTNAQKAIFKVVIHKPGKFLNFEEAQTNCEQNGMALASIHNQKEMNYLVELIALESLPETVEWREKLIFTGGNYRNREGYFEWIDGTTFDYKNWYPGEPTNSGANGEDCLALRVHANLKWNDIPCDWRVIGHVCRVS